MKKRATLKALSAAPIGDNMADQVAERIQRTQFDLDTMDEVTLVKEVSFAPVETAAQALERVGGSAEKFLAIINDGLKSELRRQAASDSSIPWQVESEDGKLSPFVGTPADSGKVNALVLTLAKTIFGYSKDMTPEEKRAAKESALDMVKTTDRMKEGLKKSAAASAE